MCLKWLWADRPKTSTSTHGTCRSCDDIELSSKTSMLRSSTSRSSNFNSSTRSSLSGSFKKEVLPQSSFWYERSEIVAATRNFSPSQQIGSSAWKGELQGSLVAIFQKSGEPEKFKKSLKNMHALHHRSLVKVVGGCRTSRTVFVVYEFVHGADLQSCLCRTVASGYTVLSTWRLRMKVAVDVAKGLEYIHEHTSSSSAHKYLTSSSIMLTNDSLQAKLTLVGMSILTGEVSAGENVSVGNDEVAAADPQKGNAAIVKRKSASPSSKKIKGVRGYIPPEYATYGAVSQKYDVFTFGIVLLELLKGEGVRQEEKSKSRKASIVNEVRPMFSEESVDRGMLRLWIDRRLQDSYPIDDALKVVRLALSCVNENPDKRPTMKEVTLHMAILLNLAEVWERGRNTLTGTATLVGR